MSVIGFDIGNENSYIATVKSGGIEILDNEYSLRSTSTYIAFTEKSREVGVSAKSKLVTNLENTVFGFKRILGKKQADDPELNKELEYIPHEICHLPSGDIGIKVSYLKNNVIFSVEQLMAMMLTKLKVISESKLGSTIRDCVVSVPAYYTDAQRRAMLDAVNIAELKAVKLMNESAAVALSYGFFKSLSEEPQNVVFVDLGNSAITVTACAFLKDKVKILGCVWDYVGGRDFDTKLALHFIDNFKVKFQLDATTNKKALMSLMLECEKLKKHMSTNPFEFKFEIECFMEDKDVYGQIKRDVFENLSADLFNRIENVLRGILTRTQLNIEHIHSVEIVGGSSRLPAVKQLIRKIFDREPKATLNQDEAVARGCALQCALLSPSLKTKDFVVEDIPSYVIRIVWKNVKGKDEELEVFSFSDKIPAYKAITISMSKPFSLEARFIDSVGYSHKIGSFSFKNIPVEAECGEVMELKFKACLDSHGIFSLTSAKMIRKSVETEENVCEVKTRSEEERQSEEGKKSISSDQMAEEVKPTTCVVKLYDLTINSDVPGLSKTEINEYVNAEQQMICTEIEEKQKANARNTLEEYIYDARSDLNNQLYPFVSESDRESLFQHLHNSENWLYDNEEQDVSEYFKRLKEMKSSVDLIFKRYTEWKERPIVIDEYQRTLQTALDTLNHLSTTESSKDILKDVENLRKMWQKSNKYLEQSMESFSKLNMHDDVPITVEDLKKSMSNFQKEFQNSYADLKRKIECIKENSQALVGDGIAGEPKHTNQETNTSMQTENAEQQNISGD